MKFFWWGSFDALASYQPNLFSANTDTGEQHTHYSPQIDLPQLLKDGYVEISTRSAHNLGFPA